MTTDTPTASTYVDIPFIHSRRFPDPFEPSVVSHMLYVDVRFLPDFPNEPNARPSDYRETASVYKSVRKSLLNQDDATPGIFGYKHLGINLIARHLEPVSDKVARVYFGEGDGCINGGHGVKIIRDTQKSERIENMPPNFIKVFVTTGLGNLSGGVGVIAEIAGANNSSIQVRDDSLLDLEGMFAPFKKAMQQTAIGEAGVAWHEGDDGHVPVADLLAMMNCFRVKELKSSNPIESYYQKKRVIDNFRAKPETFYAVAPLLPDLCILMDAIRTEGQEPYNKIASGNFGRLRFVVKKEKKVKGNLVLVPDGIELDFTRRSASHALAYAAAYPIFAAFRLLVEYDTTTEQYKWKDGGLQKALRVWADTAPELITTIRRADHKTIMMLGRDPGIWEAIYTKIDNVLLREKLAVADDQ